MGALGHRPGTGGYRGQGLPKLSSFCSSHGVARRLLGIWGPPQPWDPQPGTLWYHKWEAAFQLLGFFFFLIWVMHNQNKHTEEKPTQPEGLFLSWCVQLTCGVAGVVLGLAGTSFPICGPSLGQEPSGRGGLEASGTDRSARGLGCSVAWGCCGISSPGAALEHCSAHSGPSPSSPG